MVDLLTMEIIINKTSKNCATRDFGSIWASACPSARPFVCPALLVPLAACACHARPFVRPSHAHGHTSSQSCYYI